MTALTVFDVSFNLMEARSGSPSLTVELNKLLRLQLLILIVYNYVHSVLQIKISDQRAYVSNLVFYRFENFVWLDRCIPFFCRGCAPRPSG